ncbi:type I phosphodiesterase/nucleotide pyrophosphatase [Sinorhizobium medicae]|uniref:alkaline phosphatase family protein n=1 Tax=Sinorhizobium medicae TaxID=110321 RepID=UPI001296591C|nr:alkaline phosphatase family protein [Sinorhizobium medicae]MDX0414772.1 type I phosphodiesterase/nucleotide pyrophosphatase [Sinorhizobium medicae]MDX0469403.1 type I phosphodiesterase/nucleotide pyrophosphatase [Sinorhizobium medicae]MDX0475726.1 type I phosphodiesterase/nucleotide pyrophosphatase [Sinorhizobium medicae]MDX0900952.1 type I phosphodiesterase/nucleotide pyrophosphatase [Sinorhizobium medicae]MDX1176563.1 type I phosphodiesterase/nucleotide pyrophosphatase [Sinorhizobium medi
MKFIVAVFDGLRPDQLNERITPNLCSLASMGMLLANHTASFPSETRVSSAALATGSHCSGHGIIANRFFANGVAIDGSSLPALLTLGSETSGVLTSVALGEVLAAHRRTMLTIGSQSQGSWGLSGWGSWQAGAPAYWVHNHGEFGSNPVIHRIASNLPPLPKGESPAIKTIKRVVDAFLSYVETEPLPDLNLLWFSEPDISFHLFGLGHPSANEVLSIVDREFGRILEWWYAARRRERIQVIAGSDHGHAIIGKTVSVLDHLRRAGFKVANDSDPDADVIMESQRAVNFWVRDSDLCLVRDIYQCLSAEPWFGAAFSRTLEGGVARLAQTLPHAAVMAEHSRSPDLTFVLGECSLTNTDSESAAVYYDGNYPVGVGMHGGLTSYELSAFGVLAGDWFQKGVSNTPTGIVDLAPTILTGLGLPIPKTVQGRVIEEAIIDNGDKRSHQIEDASVSVHEPLRKVTIRRERYRGHLYLKGSDIVWHSPKMPTGGSPENNLTI